MSGAGRKVGQRGEVGDADVDEASRDVEPPPLPLLPPFGPDFYPSDSEEEAPVPPPHIKPVRRFVPDSWKKFFSGWRHVPKWGQGQDQPQPQPAGIRCSPPPSLPPGPESGASTYPDPSGMSGGSCPWRLETQAILPPEPSGAARAYSEEVEAYRQRYNYMKSWAGLLRILGVVQLLLGAAVFACITAYVHKDNEWYNMFGYSQPYSFGASSIYGGYYYSGPKTPFVLVVAGLVWIVTVVLLVLGMSMYYRTILLDSSWWPLTEFGINISLFILYMAAAIVYVNDTNRGGLCYYPLFNTPLNASFCRIEGGQTAAMIFLFVTMIVYLISAIVCLKLWRHEGARRHRELVEQEMKTQTVPPKRMYENDDRLQEEVVYRQLKSVEVKPELLNGHIPAGHIPKPIVMPDYLAKYPAIQTDEMRERYKAVFNDQFSEYKELSAEVQAVLKKFDELDTWMRKLPHHSGNMLEQERISKVLQEYNTKKNDPSFLEKKERCEYLKNKLSHIKQRIQDYDKVMNWNVQT